MQVYLTIPKALEELAYIDGENCFPSMVKSSSTFNKTNIGKVR